jgi:hypothetical protein
MEMHPVSSFFVFVRSGVIWLKNARNRNTNERKFQFYRYDSTGRLVHFGPEGETLDNDSSFQRKDLQYKHSAGAT